MLCKAGQDQIADGPETLKGALGVQEASSVMEHKLCRSVAGAHMVLRDQGVVANAILGALGRASDEAQLAQQVGAPAIGQNPDLKPHHGTADLIAVIARTGFSEAWLPNQGDNVLRDCTFFMQPESTVCTCWQWWHPIFIAVL